MKIYRAGLELADVSIDKTSTFTQQLMGEHKVDANWISPAPLELTLGDYIELGNERLYLNRPTSLEKKTNFTYRYAATFEGEIYELYRKILIDEGSADFPYFGDPEDYMLLILENLNSINPGWTLNIDLPVAYEPIALSFNEESCRVALTRIMEAFQLEFRLVQKEIIVRQDVGFASTHSFEYGRGNGLYRLTRDSKDDSEVVTRIYGFGGDRNLKTGYREGSKRLVFDLEGKRYLESNTELYGIREGVVTFPEIYPRRTGSVSEAMAYNQVKDSTLDFDINAQLIGGVTAKIVFKSGALSGYEFDIESYDDASKVITFIPKEEADGLLIPDQGSFQPEEGDSYTLINIDMPEAYVIAAEAELLAATQDAHISRKSPQVVYGLELDEKYIQESGTELACGMRVAVKDDPIGLDETIRIFAISYPLVNPSLLTAQIADTIPYTVAERIQKDLVTTKKEVVEVDRSRIEGIRDSVQRIRKLQERLYDPDGYFDTTNLRPLSLETLFFSSGAKSRNYSLNGVEIETNYQGDPDALRISGGKLIHWEIAIPELGYIWEMDQNIFSDLDPDQEYFVYARCNRSALTGTWVVSIDPILTEQEVGFYHFGLGTLFLTKEGTRYFEFEKGMTFIVGDMIKTGTIQSYDGLNFFDLTTGKFNLGDENSGLDWDVTNEGALTIRGAVIAKAILADDGVIANLKVKSLKTAETGQRMEILAYEDAEETIPAHHQKFYDQEGNLALTIDSKFDSEVSSVPGAGINIVKEGSDRSVFVTQNGVMSEGSFLGSSSLPTNLHLGSVLGVLKQKFFSAFGLRAGVIGYDATPEGGMESYGGWFNDLLAWAVHFGVRQVTSNYTCTRDDYLISCYNSSTININLPADPKKGRVIEIRTNNDKPTQIFGNGKQIRTIGLVNSIALNSTPYSRQGRTHRMIYDGTSWLYNSMPVVGVA